MKTRVVFVFAVIILAPVFVATQNQPSSAKKRENAQQANPAVPITVNCNCASEARDGKDKPQGWHELVAWPEGIATWALIATLGAILYQAILTHLSVRVARNALIASLRPRLVVKRISLIPGKLEDVEGAPTLQDDHQWRIGCVVANIGASKAQVIGSDVTIERLGIGTLEGLLPSLPPYQGKYSFGNFSLEGGERHERIVALNANEETRELRIAHRTATIRGQRGIPPIMTSPIVCFGFFRYRDESGVNRLTGFGYLWNPEDLSFTRLEYPNYEYTD